GQAGPLGWTGPAALGVARSKPGEIVGALSGDYDFQFMIEELAVGAQHRIPYVHVVVNNSYLGLIRQSQRGFDMDFEVSLAFENINASGSTSSGYGVDHVAVAQVLGCKAVRVEDPALIGEGLRVATELMNEHQVPVDVEVIIESVMHISMGTELDVLHEFNTLAQTPADAPTALTPMGELAAAKYTENGIPLRVLVPRTCRSRGRGYRTPGPAIGRQRRNIEQ